MSDDKHVVWVDDVVAPTYTYAVFEEPNGTAMEVLATSEQVVRWQGAQRAWEAAQAEMKALYKESSDIADAVEAVEEHLADEEWAKQKQDNEALEAIAEAEAEAEHGPRQWALVSLFKDNGARTMRNARSVCYARRVHRKDCPVYVRLMQGDSESTSSAEGWLGKFERTPEALSWLRKPPMYREPKVEACKRCCGDLIAIIESEQETTS